MNKIFLLIFILFSQSAFAGGDVGGQGIYYITLDSSLAKIEDLEIDVASLTNLDDITLAPENIKPGQFVSDPFQVAGGDVGGQGVMLHLLQNKLAASNNVSASLSDFNFKDHTVRFLDANDTDLLFEASHPVLKTSYYLAPIHEMEKVLPETIHAIEESAIRDGEWIRIESL